MAAASGTGSEEREGFADWDGRRRILVEVQRRRGSGRSQARLIEGGVNRA